MNLNFKIMKIYYARPISLYNTKQEERDISMLESLGFEVVNPNKEELQKRYEKEGMDVFLTAINDCQALAFRAFVDCRISQGVWKELQRAIEQEKPVIELPSLLSIRELNVGDTREYLKLLGHR